MSLRDELQALIAREEDKVRASFGLEVEGNRSRLALFQLVRALDFFWFFPPGEEAFSEEQRHSIAGNYRVGWSRAMHLFLDEEVDAFAAPLFRSDETLQRWAESAIAVCGHISQLQQALDYERSGLCELQEDDAGSVHVYFKPRWVGLEAIEREHFDWVRNFVHKTDALRWKKLEGERTAIKEELIEQVQVWGEHFLSYRATPRIEAYHHEAGLLYSRQMFGQDSFSGESLFGGLPFDLYRSIAATLVGWALQHGNFARALLHQHPNLNPFNLLTMNTSEWEMAEQLSDTLAVEPSAARQALHAFVLDRSNCDEHCLRIAAARPPLVQAGRGWVYKSLAGCTDSPFLFLLRELKRLHPDDYFRAVNGREARFRRELYDLLPFPHLVKSRAGVGMRDGNRSRTDADAAIYDSQAQALGLFQLKWHDPFGSAMKDRGNRRTNFEPVAGRWVEATDTWLRSHDLSTLLMAMGLRDARRLPVKEVYLFVIGRHFAHFSGDEKPDERAAYGMWPQMLRIVSEDIEAGTFDLLHPIAHLHRRLQETSPLRQELPELNIQSFGVGGRDVIFHPPDQTRRPA